MPAAAKQRIHKDDYFWYRGDCFDLLKRLPDKAAQLIFTSPPYNIGKEYEDKIDLAHYLSDHERLISECSRVLSPTGSICWQVGNFVEASGEIIPLDILLYRIFKKFNFHLRNRIVWTYGHGMHMRHRFSGRYENIMWFTKSEDFVFNLDEVRVPQNSLPNGFIKDPRKGKSALTLSEKIREMFGTSQI